MSDLLAAMIKAKAKLSADTGSRDYGPVMLTKASYERAQKEGVDLKGYAMIPELPVAPKPT